MDEAAQAAEMLPFARAVARRMSRDPEDESLAAYSMLKAIRTYDGRIPLKRWIAHVIKKDVWHRWRKVKVRSVVKLGGEFFDPACEDEPITDSRLTQTEWKVLCEKFLSKWPDDVIARRNNMTVYGVRKMVSAAIARLQE